MDLLDRQLSITQFEALNLVHAVTFLLPPAHHEYVVKGNMDNLAHQQVLDSGKGRDLTLCACTRQLWLLAAKHNVELSISHKLGKDLILVDALRVCTSAVARA